MSCFFHPFFCCSLISFCCSSSLSSSTSPLALCLLLSYGRKAAQAQGNGINFHSRLNSQSISLELNTLPPIRKSQGSISSFPRRHSPAIQREPRQPCLTFWRRIGSDWPGAAACCSFLQTMQRTWQTTTNVQTTLLAEVRPWMFSCTVKICPPNPGLLKIFTN